MRSHLDAVKDKIAPLGYTTHLWTAPEVSGQYLILSSPAWDDALEESVCGLDESLDTEFRIKAVAGTPAGVEVMLRRVRGLLSPGRSWERLAVPARSAQTKFARSEFIGVDTSTKVTGTDRHPGVGVDSYRLVSEPT